MDSEADDICPSKDKRDGCHQVSFSIPSLLEKVHHENKKKKLINTPPFIVNPQDDQKKSCIGIFIKNHNKKEGEGESSEHRVISGQPTKHSA